MLRGTLTDNGGYLLTCTNGQPWGDEVIHKTAYTASEIDNLARLHLNTMLPDGNYTIDHTMNSAAAINGKNIVYENVAHTTVLGPDHFETNMIMTRVTGSSSEMFQPMARINIPISANCKHPIGTGESTSTESYTTFYQKTLNYVKTDANPTGPLPLAFTVKDGEVVTIYWIS